MWNVSALALVDVEYPPLAGSDGPGWSGHALTADGERIAERVESIAWDRPKVGTDPCPCGDPECSSASYVELRRTEDHVVWVPAMVGTWFAAPGALDRRGTAIIDAALWDATWTGRGLEAPAAASLPPLRWSDAWRIAQFEAPQRMLGSPGEPPPDLAATCIGSDPYVSPEELRRLADITAWGPADALTRFAAADDVEVISLYFDDNREARLFARRHGAWCLYVASGHVLFPDGSA